MFLVEVSELPRDFCPQNITLDEDLMGMRIWVLNPNTRQGRWFIHNPETDKVRDPSGEELIADVYKGPGELELHILND